MELKRRLTPGEDLWPRSPPEGSRLVVAFAAERRRPGGRARRRWRTRAPTGSWSTTWGRDVGFGRRQRGRAPFRGGTAHRVSSARKRKSPTRLGRGILDAVVAAIPRRSDRELRFFRDLGFARSTPRPGAPECPAGATRRPAPGAPRRGDAVATDPALRPSSRPISPRSRALEFAAGCPAASSSSRTHRLRPKRTARLMFVGEAPGPTKRRGSRSSGARANPDRSSRRQALPPGRLHRQRPQVPSAGTATPRPTRWGLPSTPAQANPPDRAHHRHARAFAQAILRDRGQHQAARTLPPLGPVQMPTYHPRSCSAAPNGRRTCGRI